MIGKLFFFGLCAAAFAQESNFDLNADLETLKALTEDGGKRVLQSVAIIADAPRDFKNLTEERVGCLIWEHQVQKAATNKTIAEAISKGMLKNKQFSNFQCVGKAGQELLEKIDSMEPQVPVMSEKIREKALTPIRALGLLMPGFSDYCKDLLKVKTEEMKKATDVAGRIKILNEVGDKMKLLQSVLTQVNDFVKNTRYKFLEEHINFAYQVENNVRKAQREGAQKILKCVN